jgi:hypothetical protein
MPRNDEHAARTRAHPHDLLVRNDGRAFESEDGICEAPTPARPETPPAGFAKRRHASIDAGNAACRRAACYHKSAMLQSGDFAPPRLIDFVSRRSYPLRT